MTVNSRIQIARVTPSSFGARTILQRKCACGGTPGPTGECEACKRKRLGLQTKLTINQPGDQYEQEADRVAEAVVGGASSSRSFISSLGSNAAQRERQAAGGEEVSGTPPILDEVLQSSGQPLEGATRAVMEERFGYDFSRVRIHCDRQAGQSAQAVSADAYTVGHHVVFAPDRYAPGTTAGQQLLAHELVHVVQQSAAAGSAISEIDSPESPRERAAEGATKSILSGGMPPPQRSVASPRIQRQAAAGGATPPASSPCRIHFRKGTTEFTNAKEFARCMEAIRAYLKGAGATKIVELDGYASEEGTAALNRELSDKRTKIVKLLLGKGGIDTSRVKLSAHGEDKSYPTLEENRRVEIILARSRTRPVKDKPVGPPRSDLLKLYELTPEPDKAAPRPGTKLSKETGAETCPLGFLESHVFPGDPLASKMLKHALNSLCAALYGKKTKRNDKAVFRSGYIFGPDWRAHAQTIYDNLWKLVSAFGGGYTYECITGCEPLVWGESLPGGGEGGEIRLCHENLKEKDVPFIAEVMIHEMGHLKLGLKHAKEEKTCTGDTTHKTTHPECYANLAHEFWRVVQPEYTSKTADLCLSGGGAKVTDPSNWD